MIFSSIGIEEIIEILRHSPANIKFNMLGLSMEDLINCLVCNVKIVAVYYNRNGNWKKTKKKDSALERETVGCFLVNKERFSPSKT